MGTFHRDLHTRENSNRKYMSSFAKKIDAEDDNGVSQSYFDNRFVKDTEHTLAYFKKVAKRFNEKHPVILSRNLDGKEIRKEGDNCYYSDEDLYEALMQSDSAKMFCEKQVLRSWGEIIDYIVDRDMYYEEERKNIVNHIVEVYM